MEDKLKEQFGLRSSSFDFSAGWITDERLIAAHTAFAGRPAGGSAGKALDLCCGTGRMGRALLSTGWDVRGLDICGDMIAIASRYFPAVEGKAEKMPFPSDTFDLVVCRQTFQFLQAADALAEISRILVPGAGLS